MKLITKPVKGLRDFLPDDMQIRDYIFKIWRTVCQRYGFEEYDGPLLENIKIYEKSGSDLGTAGKELYSLNDRGGRLLAIRPEMTPTVGRMIAEYGPQLTKPIKWYNIGQFFRAENPQRGRGREFYQLNADIFGEESISADMEIIKLILDILFLFGAGKKMFELRINHRGLTDYYFKEQVGLEAGDRDKILKIIDAYPKQNDDWLNEQVKNLNNKSDLAGKVKAYLNLNIEGVRQFKDDCEGARRLVDLFELLSGLGLSEYCKFDPAMARGFDYYTGVVFEVFDKHPENSRSMFGGGRYDNLLDIFGKPKIPAVGVAPGDITTRLFLESWHLLPEIKKNNIKCLVTTFVSQDNESRLAGWLLADKLRQAGIVTEVFLDERANLAKQFKYAHKKGIPWVAILGPEELQNKQVSVKDMQTRQQEKLSIDKLVERMKT